MKLKIFQSYLQQEEVDLVFLADPDPNFTYFTQLKPTKAFLVIKPESVQLYLSKLDSSVQITGIEVKILYPDWKEQLTDKKIRKIGINKENMTLSFFEKLKKIYPLAKYVDVSGKLKELRREKTSEEIKKIKKACQITDGAFQKLIENISSLKTEKEVAFYLEKEIKDKDAELAFPVIAANGKHSAVPHHLTSNQKLKSGFLLLDFGASYKNYCSDMSRMIYLGNPSEKEQQQFDLLLKVQEETISQVKQGGGYAQLVSLAREKLRGYSSYFIHHLGHGVGVEIHEAPSLSLESTEKIRNGEVFTIEPGIYFPNHYGLRIEDTILFNHRTTVLTKSSKELARVKLIK